MQTQRLNIINDERLSRTKVDWVERINGQLSIWLDSPFPADFLLEKNISEGFPRFE